MFCVPVPHDRTETTTPVVVFGVAAVDLLLLIPILLGNSHAIIARFGFTPAHPLLLTFIGAMFLHVGIWHYLGNMWFFWIFGQKVEATLGHWWFLLLFLGAGVGGQLLYWLLNLHSNIPCVGASGAISGIAGAYLVLYPRDRFDLYLYLGWIRIKKFESDARFAVGAWIGEQTLLGLLSMLRPFSAVAFWAHVGGFVFGAALAWAYHARVPVASRPVLAKIEMPLDDEIPQPNPLIGLNLSSQPSPSSIGRSTPIDV